MVAERSVRIRAPRPYKQDARAYLLIEEARLRCERLESAARTEARRSELHRLHRYLGLAGLYVSTDIPSEMRRALLARVHSRCDHRGGGSVRGFQRTLRGARRALGRAVAKVGRNDHLVLAQLHLVQAMEFMTPRPSPRPSVTEVLRARHLA